MSFIISVDFLGYQEHLKVNSESRFKSLFGGLISILIVIISVAWIFYLALDLFLKNDPFIIFSVNKLDSVGPYQFSKNELEIFVGVEFSNFSYYIDERIYTVSASETIITNIINKNGSTEQEFIINPLEVQKCKDVYTVEEVKIKNITFPYELFYCLKPNQAKVEGYWGANIYRSVRIFHSKCENNTLNNNHCLPRDEIDSYLQNGVLSEFLSDYFVDPKSNDNYLNSYYRDIYTKINSQNGVSIDLSLANLLFTTDTGFIFKNFENKNVFKINNEKYMYSFGETQNFATTTIEGFHFGEIYLRYYLKFQDFLTRIGGLIKALMVLGSILINVYSKTFYIMNSFINFNQTFSTEEKNVNQDIVFKFNKKLEIPNFVRKINLTNNPLTSNQTINNFKFSEMNYTNLQWPERIVKNPVLSESDKIIKPSKINLFCNYWCRKNFIYNLNRNIKNSSLNEYELLLNKSLSVNTIMKNNFDTQVIKHIIVDSNKIELFDKLYLNLFNPLNKYVYCLKSHILDNKEEEEYFSQVDNFSISEKLVMINN